MKLKEARENSLFRWPGDWRIFCRLSGETKLIDGQECVPARPIQPTLNQPAGYIPAGDEITLFEEKSLRIM